MMKSKWNSGYTKAYTTDSIQNIPFLFIEKNFFEKNSFLLKFSKKMK